MSGHSKWATIKHKKGAADAKRGKVFTRLIKEITIAAKSGGGDPDGNPASPHRHPRRQSREHARREHQARDPARHRRARRPLLRRDHLRGLRPGGVAIIVDVLTDNKNRAVSEIRHAFSKNGGNLGAEGAVSWMFSKKGVISIVKEAANEDKLMEIVLESGAEDLNDEGEHWEILCDPA